MRYGTVRQISLWCWPVIGTVVAEIRRDIWLTVLNNHAVFLSYYSRTCLMTSNESSEVLSKHVSPFPQFSPYKIIFILPVAKDNLSWERLHNSMVTDKTGSLYWDGPHCSWYMDSHHKGELVMRPCHHDGNLYTGKTASLHWNGSLGAVSI